MATKFITVRIEIMHDKNLNQSQKFILAEIEQLSQLDKGCIGSNNHFSNLIGITKENVSRNIKELQDKGYIDVKIINGTRNHTRIITLTTLVTHPYQSSKPPLLKQQETKENKTINKTINKVETDKSVSKPPLFLEDDMKLALKMYHSILRINDGFKKPNLNKWADEFRLMREQDFRKINGMDLFIDSLYGSEESMWQFWRGNILSPKSMRKNFDKVVTQYKSRRD